MDRVYRLLTHRPGWVLAGVGAVTLVFLAQLYDLRARQPRLRIETEVNQILPAHDENRRFYDLFRERFGNDELLLVALLEDDVFTAVNLRRIQRMTRRFADVDGVRRVVSLSNTLDIRASGDQILVQPLYDDVPEDPAVLRDLRRRVLENPVHAGTLVSRDGRAASFLIYPLDMSEKEFRDRGIDRQIERIAKEESGTATVVMAGGPPVKAATSRLLLRDLAWVLPAGFACMAAIAFATFRTARGVAIPLASIFLAQLWTLGVIALSDRALNLVTYVVPPLINAIGFAYAVHVVAEHAEVLRERGAAGPQAAFQALRRVAPAVFLTALTTAAGFLSLCTSSLPAIREFGLFCAVAVLATLVIALAFAPAVLSLLPYVTPAARPGRERRLEALAGRVAAFDVRHRRSVLLAGGVVGVLALIGITRLEVSTALTDNLKPDHPLRRGIEAFDRSFDGSATFHVVLDAGARDEFKRPENLELLRELQGWLERQPEIRATTSLSDYVMVVNRALHDGDPEHFAIPASRSLISQSLFFFWSDQLEHLVDPSFSAASILVRAPSLDSQGYARVLDRIEEHLGGLPDSFTAHVTGNIALLVRTIDDIALGQALSLSAALLIIGAILVVFFRSLRIGLLALLPNALPVVVYFGTLGLAGVTLNVISSLIACIILGIAVDDTIHFLVRFRELAGRLGDEGKAAVEALRTVARPVTSTTVALSLGFGLLATSSLKSQFEFGVMSAAMLAFAWLVDLTFTPALACRLRAAGGRSQ